MSTHTAIAATSKGVLGTIQLLTLDPGPGEVLLKVEYASMIPFDVYTTDNGLYVENWPVPLGFGASGIIVKTGSEVIDLDAGDRVSATICMVYTIIIY